MRFIYAEMYLKELKKIHYKFSSNEGFLGCPFMLCVYVKKLGVATKNI